MAKKTYQQIQAEIDRLQKEAAAVRKAEVSEVIAKIQSAIAAYGLTAADLGFSGPAAKLLKTRKAGAKSPAKGATAKPKARAAKFRDAEGNAWSGIGKRPRWFTSALAAGKTPEELLAK